jgi:hypothetical protein
MPQVQHILSLANVSERLADNHLCIDLYRSALVFPDKLFCSGFGVGPLLPV